LVAVPIGIAGAALIASLGTGGLIWLLPTLLPALIVLLLDRGRADAIRMAGWTLVVLLVLAIPVVITPEGVFNPLQKSLTIESELGNLNGPLNALHIAGLWPALDFRTDPHLKPAVLALAVVCLGLAAGTVFACVRLRGRLAVPFAAYAGGAAAGAAAIILVGSPWVDGKAMATASPALLAAAMLGIVLIRQRTAFRVEATVLGVIVVGVVAWSAFLAYQGVWFAPRSHYTELEKIADSFAGQGPTLVDEVSIYGPRHFLRKLDAEGATDRRPRSVLLTGGRASTDDSFVDLDDIQSDQFTPYNLVIVRRGPTRSRPPSGFALVYSGKYYEVWRRIPAAAPPGVLKEHLALGDQLDPGGVPACADVARLASEAGPAGRLIAARVSSPVTVHIGQAHLPDSWRAPTTDTVAPTDSGTLTTGFTVPASGDYELWLSGAVFGGAQITVDGQDAGSERGILNNGGGYEPLSKLNLAAGSHTLELHYSGASLEPGSAVVPFGVGPLILDAAHPGDLGFEAAPSADYARFCGSRWDWIEAYS
jgi:hypothetical protein